MGKRNVLGRGLGALIPGADEEATMPPQSSSEDTAATGQQVVQIDVSTIEPNPHQPRMEFDPETVDELAQSIREKGIIQPITVRKFGDGYQLVAGERRLRAARQAGLQTVPALLLSIGTDQEMMELSLIENIQREDLNPLEEARAYRMLIEQCYLTQEDVAQRVGKNRSTVANILRLLSLPAEVRDALQADRISMGHARALLGLEDERLQVTLCKQIIARGLSVRRVEALVKAYRDGKDDRPGAATRPKDPQIVSIEEDLQHRLGTGVNINRRGKKGKIEIEFYTDDDLERILDMLRGVEF